MKAESLELRYIPLHQVTRWDQNPKKHDFDALIRSIERHGFVDAPKLDQQLGAVVFGNGRVEALERMKAAGKPAPRGIKVLADGEWAIPVLTGLDSVSRESAVSLGIDHNNLVLLGGDLEFTDLLAIWDGKALERVLAETPNVADLLVSFSAEDVESLLAGPKFEPVAADDQSRLDKKKPVTCPSCGHEFEP